MVSIDRSSFCIKAIFFWRTCSTNCKKNSFCVSIQMEWLIRFHRTPAANSIYWWTRCHTNTSTVSLFPLPHLWRMWAHWNLFVKICKNRSGAPLTAIVSTVWGLLPLEQKTRVESLLRLGWTWMSVSLPVICSGRSMKQNKTHYFLLSWWHRFYVCTLKSKFPLNLKINISSSILKKGLSIATPLRPLIILDGPCQSSSENINSI